MSSIYEASGRVVEGGRPPGGLRRGASPPKVSRAISAMPPIERKRNEDKPVPVSRVTGSSGNTDRGSLVTYSGGARG